ncbi:MAG: arginine--tRNA ligase [Tenericutes bacterium]|nr:arginine--tRNA ligase [Mycoplasmatota bacterium]MDD6941776.1 arginine--tRNA ligase [bacterium]MDY2696945.1 arginine--tRNA ligase [Bacilli bacterium]
MSLIKNIEKEIKNTIESSGYSLENFVLQPSSRPDLGQYQINDSMILAKKYGKNPRDIANDIVKELEKDKRFTNINIAGPGFINISLTDEYLTELLNMINTDITSVIDKKEPKKIILDYGGANVAKALHVGHLRSANIGEALKRLAILLGYEVLGDAHLGDYGRPLGFVVLEIKKRYPDLPYFDPNYTGDYSEIELPITNEELEKIYPEASRKAKEDENYLEEGRDVTAKIQNHIPGYYDLWKKVVDISKADIKNVYDDINVHFELWQGESDAAEYFNELEEFFEKSGVLIESSGAKIIEVKEETDKAPMPPLLFVKSNGTLSYETTDLATILERKKNYNPDEIWYLTDARQELHFIQVFRAAKKAKLVNDDIKLVWFGFGTMNGKDGKPFKTRDGGVMSLKGLINLIYDETIKRINPETVSADEKEKVAKTVAIAALKYADFLPYRGTDYIFEVEKFADLEGKTGPYLLYSTIRMKSLLNKAKNIKQEKATTITTATEREIILNLLGLPRVLDKALEAKSLNDIAEYLYKLTSQYNKFYSENKIITEENEYIRESWLILTTVVYNINMLLLNTLGISVPEKM